MSIETRRAQAVSETVEKIRSILSSGLTSSNFEIAGAELGKLAQQTDLFSRADFPVPTGDHKDRTYKLQHDEDGSYAIYVNSALPNQSFRPHNHGDAWAIVAAVEGLEVHNIYHRTDDGSDPEKADLKLVRKVHLGPGTVVTLMPGDIHAVEGVDAGPILHLHMYKTAFHKQTGRVDFDLEKGCAFTMKNLAALDKDDFTF